MLQDSIVVLYIRGNIPILTLKDETTMLSWNARHQSPNDTNTVPQKNGDVNHDSAEVYLERNIVVWSE
jgi:hypothetical protein